MDRSRQRALGHRATRLAPGVIERLLAIGWSADTCLNVNFPDRAVDEVGPLTLARQGVGEVQGMAVETRRDPRGFPVSAADPFAAARVRRGRMPVWAVVAVGRIAVTPIRYDRTDEAAFTALAGALPRL